jgi:2,5-dihydroxypyridine 5,6-dioxygenase
MSSYLYEYELGKAGDILCRELFALKPGETIIITADTESDPRVVDATARAAFACDARPLVMWWGSPLGVGKAADAMLPVKPLAAALKEADAWVEFNNKWLLYSTPFDIAMAENKRLRYLCLVGMDVDMMIRVLGRVNYNILKHFQQTISDMTAKAKHVRMTTPAGEDVEFDNDPNRPISCETGYADTPGSHMMAGQIGWAPVFDSINGTIVFDGSLVPPFLGVLSQPVKLHIEKGTIVGFEGGKEAFEYEAWLKSFHHPQMLKLAHVCYGFNPGARLTGNILEDERVWGGTEWGIGQVGPMYIPPDGIKGPSHTDGICLNTSVWLDGVQIMDKGVLLDPELKKLTKELGK